MTCSEYDSLLMALIFFYWIDADQILGGNDKRAIDTLVSLC